jgi:LmbE family N-acetylglucosaminyl deacetylase
MIMPMIRALRQDSRDEAEAEAAALALGAVLSCSPLWEAGMVTRSRLAGSIEDVVNEFQPDVVLAPTGAEMQTARRMVHEATVYGARKVRNLLCYQTPTSTTAFCPTLFLDIDAELEDKQRSIGCFRGTPPQLARHNAVHWGHSPQSRSSEAFQVLRLESAAMGEVPYLPRKLRAAATTSPGPELELR